MPSTPRDQWIPNLKLQAAREQAYGRKSRTPFARAVKRRCEARFSGHCGVDHRRVRRWEQGEYVPDICHQEVICEIFEVPWEERDRLGFPCPDPGPMLEVPAFGEALPSTQARPITGAVMVIEDSMNDELEALELARRVEACDVSEPTLERLARSVDDLCCRYGGTPPTDLLTPMRQYRRYIIHLLGGQTTLAQKRQLLVTGGWLSLIAACIYEDMGRRSAAVASRQTAHQLGMHTEHHEIMAWSFEIRAWQALIDGHYHDAAESCQAGQRLAGSDGSAAAQLTAQEARSWGRTKRKSETYDAIQRAQVVVARLPISSQQDHHFIFDPHKLTSFTATAFTWLGDAKPAEEYFREVIHYYDEERRPRRLATARLDLAVAVTQQDRPEEACHLGHLALDSGRLLPSNIWRATELDDALARHYGNLAEVGAFHEHYVEVRQAIKNA